MAPSMAQPEAIGAATNKPSAEQLRSIAFFRPLDPAATAAIAGVCSLRQHGA
ncbi:MAG: hypothetical protein HY245_03375 [Rhizobiales bacterium]|nr:hypothetical protein [Hyphomicrobiales bacterium]MBI3672467.1 hypothetical protein [Hyphomicrobiales bacterium]